MADDKRARECSCDIREPRRWAARARSLGGYATYLDFIEDDTTFDPACPFHGENGTMVMEVRFDG